MPAARNPEILGVDAFRQALADPGRSLKDKFKDDPLGLAERLGVLLPENPLLAMERAGEYDPEKHGPIEKGLRDLVLDVCTMQVRRAVAVGPRGGGKSFGVSFIEFFLWLLLEFDSLNMGGSELQANIVYNYLIEFLESDPFWASLIKGDPMRSETLTVEGNWIRVLTASSKSVRGQHAGGKRKGKDRGGLLVIDEEVEAEESIVEASFATVNTARPSIIVRCSTFHNLGGSFQKVVDNHRDQGYTLYRWSIFDICEPCECIDTCESVEPCFREDHWEEYIDPDTGEKTKKLIHRAYCGGRAKYATGWMRQEEVRMLWVGWNRNHNRWEVEAMGSRPTSSGQVIKDMMEFESNIVHQSARTLYKPGNPITITVDWGRRAAGVEVWQEQSDGHYLLEALLVLENSQTQIFGLILGLAGEYMGDLEEIAADIGGGGNYLNPKLRDEEGLPVRDVNFNVEKEAAVAAWNQYNENGQIIIPDQFEDFIAQVKGWRRNNSGNIIKAEDHLCDAAVCYFSKFIDRLGIIRFRVGPKTLADVRNSEPVPVSVGISNSHGRMVGGRPDVPIIRTINRGRR